MSDKEIRLAAYTAVMLIGHINGVPLDYLGLLCVACFVLQFWYFRLLRINEAGPRPITALSVLFAGVGVCLPLLPLSCALGYLPLGDS